MCCALCWPQALVFGDTPLDDDSQTLDGAGISDGGTLRLSRPLVDGSVTLGSVGVPNGGDLDLVVPADKVAADPFIVHVELPPSLQPTYGSSVTFATSATATVEEVKAKIAAITGMSKAEQQLAFGSLPLTSGTQTLGSAGVQGGDTLSLSERAPSVTVHLPNEMHLAFGPSATVAAGPTDTIEDVKALVEALTGVPPEDQTLSYAPPPETFVTVDLPSSLHATHGPTVLLAVAPSVATLADLKAKVEAQTGVPPADQAMQLGSASGVLDGTTALTDDTATLASLGVQRGGNVDLSLPNGPSPPPAFAVTVEMPTSVQPLYGETITIPTSASESVADVKAKVEAITGMRLAEQVAVPCALPTLSQPAAAERVACTELSASHLHACAVRCAGRRRSSLATRRSTTTARRSAVLASRTATRSASAGH